MPALASSPRPRPGGVFGFVLLGVLALAQPLVAQDDARRSREADSALETRIERIREHPLGLALPPASAIVRGDRTVAASERVQGPLAVAGGSLIVLGVVDGDAIALDGDVIVREGGVVRGSALSVGGHVRADGGTIEGDMRAISGVGAAAVAAAAAPAETPFEATRGAVSLVLGWLMMLAIIGIGVLMFAGSHLAAVEEALTRRFARSFWMGVLGQVAIAPVLLLLIVGLALTVIGVLLIPFAVVAYALLIAGLLTLGFLAVARRAGGAVTGARDVAETSERRVHLRALMIGLVLFFGLWFLAAVFTWSPIAGGVLRGIAVVVTWTALTVGLGATLLTRAGTRAHTPRTRPAAELDELAWTTPTPVSGVAAARRPTPLSGRATERR